MGRPLDHRLIVLAASAWMLVWTGCAGLHVGQQSLYRPELRTIYVPVFESESFRPNLGERLTEAVVKEIELKTPYKVVATPNADSVLRGRIVVEKDFAEDGSQLRISEQTPSTGSRRLGP